MTQTAHTPGPWHICEATKRDLKLVRDDNGFCVAQAIQPGNSRAAYINAEANLHLIAAAPELLELLSIARDHLEVCNYEGEEDDLIERIEYCLKGVSNHGAI